MWIYTKTLRRIKSCGIWAMICFVLSLLVVEALLWMGFSQEHRPHLIPDHSQGKWSHSVMFDSLWPHGLEPTRGFSIHGIFQARVLEWVAISFSIIVKGYKFNLEGRLLASYCRGSKPCSSIWKTENKSPRLFFLTQRQWKRHSYSQFYGKGKRFKRS